MTWQLFLGILLACTVGSFIGTFVGMAVIISLTAT